MTYNETEWDANNEIIDKKKTAASLKYSYNTSESTLNMCVCGWCLLIFQWKGDNVWIRSITMLVAQHVSLLSFSSVCLFNYFRLMFLILYIWRGIQLNTIIVDDNKWSDTKCFKDTHGFLLHGNGSRIYYWYIEYTLLICISNIQKKSYNSKYH